MLSNSSSLDCDFSTGVCPDCGAKAPPHVKRNCPKKAVTHNEHVGNELIDLFQILRVRKKPGCNCESIAAWMNFLGIEGCRGNRAELLAALEENYELYGLGEKIKAGALAVVNGLPLSLEGLFELAIERAETKAIPLPAAN